MKKHLPFTCLAVVFFITGLFFSFVFGKQPQQQTGYILEHEKDIPATEPGPHNGGGSSTAYRFFAKAADSRLVFTKRVLHPGSAIGYHLQKEEEIYYIVSGTGEMKMNDQLFGVNAGDAILTLPGSSHSITQKGKDDLVMIINYEKK